MVVQVLSQDVPEIRVQRTMANLHSNLGAPGVKRFQAARVKLPDPKHLKRGQIEPKLGPRFEEDFISTVFESPTIFMGISVLGRGAQEFGGLGRLDLVVSEAPESSEFRAPSLCLLQSL